jgi:hypothetical protein
MSTKNGALPRRGAHLYKEDWEDIIARCKRKPNQVAVVLENRPVSRAKSANTRRGAPFVQEGGRLKVHRRNGYWTEGNVEMADLHCVWETTSAE